MNGGRMQYASGNKDPKQKLEQLHKGLENTTGR